MHIDELADALYLRLDESNIIDSVEVYPGIILDFDEDEPEHLKTIRDARRLRLKPYRTTHLYPA